jgi:hypothetical protein
MVRAWKGVARDCTGIGMGGVRKTEDRVEVSLENSEIENRKM